MFALPMNKENAYNTIKSYGIKYPDLVFAQCMLESGDLKSKLSTRNHNVFGMRLPKKRKTKAIGEFHKYAMYDTWMRSVEDYKLYQDYIFKTYHIHNRASYIRYLNKKYSEVKDYCIRVNRVLKNNREIIKSHVKPPTILNNTNSVGLSNYSNPYHQTIKFCFIRSI
jgi:uncharacterized FlgJ-related protein